MLRFIRSYTVLCAALLLAGCGKKEADIQPKQSGTSPQATAAAPLYTYEVVNTFPHDPTAFTEGLLYRDGELYESTGLNGRSWLRRVELKTGKPLQQIDIPNEYFGEGIVIIGSKIYQLTYTTQIGFIYDLKTFKQIGTWNYRGEGWAMTTDGTNIIMSNGTDRLQFLDPNSLAVIKTIDVQEAGMPISDVNELEYIKGEIWANVWRTDTIVRIDPETGNVKGWINLKGLLSPDEANDPVNTPDVLNGIAYDSEHDRIFVTGKNWPKLFEIKVKAAAHSPS